MVGCHWVGGSMCLPLRPLFCTVIFAPLGGVAPKPVISKEAGVILAAVLGLMSIGDWASPEQ